MDLGIAGRRAAVAAASKGLGFGVAQALAAEGVQRRDLRPQRRHDRRGGRRDRSRAPCRSSPTSRRPAGAERFVRDARAALGGIDILVANAGGPPPGNFASVTVDQYLAAFELNCRSTIAMCYEAVPGDARAAVGACRRDHVDRGAPTDRRASSCRTPPRPA